MLLQILYLKAPFCVRYRTSHSPGSQDTVADSTEYLITYQQLRHFLTLNFILFDNVTIGVYDISGLIKLLGPEFLT